MGFLKQLFSGAKAVDSPARKAPQPSDINAGNLAARLKQSPAPYLLDVREPQEYADGHIAGAVLIPLGDLARRMGELPQDREIVCVCHSGSRSGAATRRLTGAGYNAINLTGGMMGWMRMGLPVQRGTRKA